MRHLLLILTLVTMTACNESGGGAESAGIPADLTPPVSDPANPQNPAPINPPVGGPAAPVTVPLTIYSMSRTIAPSTSYPALTFTALASCAEYNGKQYCWDDGLHSTPGGPMTFSDNYFGLQTHATTGSPQSCKLTCNSSYMAPIRDVTAYRNVSLIVLGGTLGQEVDHILANGTPTQTSCTLDQGVLTCGTLSIQVGI